MPGPSAPGVGLPAHHEGAQGRTADRAAYPLTVALLLRRLFRHLSATLFSAHKGRRPSTASRKRATYSQSGSLTQENSWIRLQQKSRTRQMNPHFVTKPLNTTRRPLRRRPRKFAPGDPKISLPPAPSNLLRLSCG